MTSWKLTALAPRPVIEAALLAHEDAWDWDPEIVISGSEIAEDKPDDWPLEAWLPRKPGKADTAAGPAPFPGTPQTRQGPRPMRADSTACRMTATEPVASNV